MTNDKLLEKADEYLSLYSGLCPNANKLIQQLADALKEREWISVEDRLPDFDVPVLCCFEHYHVKTPRLDVLIRIDDDDREWLVWDLGDFLPELSMDYNVTHWMPLPKPPVSEQEGE